MIAAEKIQEYITKELLIGKKLPIGIHDSLINSGILDSLTLLQLIAFVEKEFGVEVTATEMRAENFQTISRIQALIDSKRSAAPRRGGD